MKIIHLPETDSTNSWLARNLSDFEETVMVSTSGQTAGRGQRGNSWEAEPGANLLFSVLWRPENFPAISQFSISQAVALAIVDALHKVAAIDAKVKWPNDIYVGEKKISGILIENALSGRLLTRTIIGAGINVNQEEFLSDAPNPVSIFNITGEKTDIEELRRIIAEEMERNFSLVLTPEGREFIHSRFMSALWRGNGAEAPYRDVASDETFRAVIDSIESTGHLNLREISPVLNRMRRYAFKEVESLQSQ